jgi:chloramphenicol 3-O-phosphotransferase
MTPRLLIPVVAAALTMAAWPAAAQVYPERIHSSLRARADQQRDRARTNRDQGREEQTERTTRTVRIGASGELDVANVAGDIVVTRGTGQDVTIEIVKTARAQSVDDARALLGLVQVDVIERPGPPKCGRATRPATR